MTKVIGILDSASADSRVRELAAFHSALEAQGYIAGENVNIDYRSANNDYSKLSDRAAELVDRDVNVIVAAGGPVSALEAKKANEAKKKTIPIVFTTIDNPVAHGFVTSFEALKRPDRNLTGTWGLTSELDLARLELLSKIVQTGTIGALLNTKRPNWQDQLKRLQAAAPGGIKIEPLEVGPKTTDDPYFEQFFANLQKEKKGKFNGLLVSADPLLNSLRAQVVGLAAGLEIPAIYQWREFVTAGGLMSFGPKIAAAYRQAGAYAGRILNDDKVPDLPIVLPTQFELVSNPEVAGGLREAVFDVMPDLLKAAGSSALLKRSVPDSLKDWVAGKPETVILLSTQVTK